MTSPFTAGCLACGVPDPQGEDPIPVLVMYPSHAAEQPESLGPYTLELSRDAEIAGQDLPLVVISHGSGGSRLSHRTLARHLARNGFVVAIPEHPRNNRNNNELANTAAILANRPRHIRAV